MKIFITTNRSSSILKEEIDKFLARSSDCEILNIQLSSSLDGNNVSYTALITYNPPENKKDYILHIKKRKWHSDDGFDTYIRVKAMSLTKKELSEFLDKNVVVDIKII